MIETTLHMVDAELVLLVGDLRTCTAWRRAWLEAGKGRKRASAPRARYRHAFLLYVPGPNTTVVAIAPLQPGERRILEDLRERGFTIIDGVARTSDLPELPPPAPRTEVADVAAEAQRCLPAYCEPDEREALWARVHAQLIFLGGPSAAPVAATTSSSDGSAGGNRPPGEASVYGDRAGILGKGEGDAAFWHDRYTAYTGHWDEHREKCRVIREAGWHLATLTAAPRTTPDGDELVRSEETDTAFIARVLSVGRGWSLKEVAVNMRITEARAARIRRRAGVDIETGEDLDDRVSPNPVGRPPGSAQETAQKIEERRHLVRLLYDQGNLSYRGIGLMVGVSPATVVSDLKATRPRQAGAA